VDVPDGADSLLGVRQESTAATHPALFDQTLKMLLLILHLASLPILRPMHRMAPELLRVVYDDQ
jgi:hypothetical protein